MKLAHASNVTEIRMLEYDENGNKLSAKNHSEAYIGLKNAGKTIN